MAEGRYSTLLEKIKKGNIGTGTGMDKLKAGWIWENGQYVKVWSGATLVSYYDGETLLGTAEVDEGEDVLRPDIDTTKEGYTLYGWKADPEDTTRLETLVAEGDAINLYAYYVPNSIVVCASHWVDTRTATTTAWNSRYMGGSAYVIQESYGDSLVGRANFSINLNEYQNSRVTLWTHWYMIDKQGYGHDEGGGMGIDSNNQNQYHNGSVINDLSGVHEMSVHAFPTWAADERFVRSFGGLANVTLSNPIAWE